MFGSPSVPIALSPDGRYLAHGGLGTAIVIVEVERSRNLAILRDTFPTDRRRDSLARITSLAYAPDGTRLAAARVNGAIELVDMADAKRPFVLDSAAGACRLIRFSGDGRYLAAAGGARSEIRLIDLVHRGAPRILTIDATTIIDTPDTSAHAASVIPRGESGSPVAIAFTSDNRTIVGATSRRLMAWDVEAGAVVIDVPLTGADTSMPALALSSVASEITVAYADGRVEVRSIDDGSIIRQYTLARGVRSATYAADGKSIFLAGPAHAMWQLDPTTGQVIRTFGGGHLGGVSALANSPDGAMLASAGGDGGLLLRDPRSLRIIGALDDSIPQGEHIDRDRRGIQKLVFASRDRLLHCTMEMRGELGRVWVTTWDPIALRLIDRFRFDLHVPSPYSIYRGIFSPRGSYVTYISNDKSIVLYRVADGAPIDTLKSEGAYFEDAAFSPDESRIAVSYQDNTVQMFDVASGRTIARHRDEAYPKRLTFSPDGKVLYFHAHIRMASWDLVTDSVRHTLIYDESSPFEVSADGRWIILEHGAGPSILALPELRPVQIFAVRPEPITTTGTGAMLPAPDLTSIVMGVADGSAALIHTSPAAFGEEDAVLDSTWSTPVPIRLDPLPFATANDTTRHYTWAAFSGHRGAYVAIAPDGDRVVTEAARAPILWNVDSARPHVLNRPATLSASFSPGGDTIAFGESGQFSIVDAPTGRTLRTIKYDGGEGANSIMYSPDGRRIALVAKNNYFGVPLVSVWDIASQSWRSRFPHPAGYPPALLRFSHDGDRLACSSARGDTLYLYDLRGDSLRLTCGIPTHGNENALRKTSAVFSDDDSTLLCANASGRFSVLRCATGEAISTFDFDTLEFHITAVAISPDGSMIVGAFGNDTVRAWSAGDGRILWTITDVSTVSQIAFAAHGDRILLGSSGSDMKIIDARTGRITDVIGKGHGSAVTAVAHSHDGTLGVSVAEDIRIWDLASGELVHRFPFNHEYYGLITSVAFSSDDRYLALLRIWRWSGTTDFAMSIHDAATGKVVQTVYGRCIAELLSLSNDAGRLAFVAPDSSIVTGELPNWTNVSVLPFDRKPIGLDWSPSGDSLALFGDDGSAAIIDMATRRIVQRNPIATPYKDTAQIVTWMRQLFMLQVFHSNHNNAAWLARDNTLATRAHMERYAAGSSTADGAWSVVAAPDSLRVYRRSEGMAAHYFVVGDRVARDAFDAVSIAPDGSSIIAGTAAGTVIVWRTIAK
jgi:WD40 repeat protein